MKKSYVKPDAAYIDLMSAERIADLGIDGEMGTDSNLPEGWD